MIDWWTCCLSLVPESAQLRQAECVKPQKGQTNSEHHIICQQHLGALRSNSAALLKHPETAHLQQDEWDLSIMRDLHKCCFFHDVGNWWTSAVWAKLIYLQPATKKKQNLHNLYNLQLNKHHYTILYIFAGQSPVAFPCRTGSFPSWVWGLFAQRNPTALLFSRFIQWIQWVCCSFGRMRPMLLHILQIGLLSQAQSQATVRCKGEGMRHFRLGCWSKLKCDFRLQASCFWD